MSNNNSNGTKDFFTKHKKVIAISGIAVLAVAATVGGVMANINNKVKSWEDKVYPGVHAYGVDLSGKTKDEAVAILNDQLATLVNDKSITVTVGDKSFNIKYADIGSTINADKTAEEALAYGKEEGMFKKNSYIKDGVDTEVNTELTYDEAKLKEFEDKINTEVEIPAVDASITISYGEKYITPEVIGKKINAEELHTKLVDCIDPDPNKVETVSLELQDYSPRITAEELNKIDGIIGSFSGSYTNDGTGRVTNMQLATGYINGTLLMPGDEFSYNKTILDTTPENGYKEANTYVGSEVVPNYGGGVCQISTFLYRAVITSNIRSTIRYNHSMMVGYSEPSLDATVFEGDIDYRFINTYNSPIYIEGYMGGSTITFNVYGNTSEKGNKTYELVNNVIEKYDYTTEYVDDPTLEEGKTRTKLNGAPGYKSEGYLITYENGVEVNRELISTDVYQPMNAIVLRGTKKVEAPKPEEKPEEKPTENTEGQTPAQ
ncbi:VanW family protein [Clostridium sp. NSJ-49]|uniref:VanW family protein n=1 Tax=Clostridium TaxID=1485 RepID=UPI001FAC4D87|nr:VanW family protein [Clostridium sp. NSJ-49]